MQPEKQCAQFKYVKIITGHIKRLISVKIDKKSNLKMAKYWKYSRFNIETPVQSGEYVLIYITKFSLGRKVCFNRFLFYIRRINLQHNLDLGEAVLTCTHSIRF